LSIAKWILSLAVTLSLFTGVIGCQSKEPAKITPGMPQPNAVDFASMTLPKALTNGNPTLAEFGRGTCIPCKEMKPVLENLAAEYQNRLNVSIVSVDDYRELTNYYRIMAIPTQIGFDSNGNEVFRHVGFWSRDEIIPQLSKLGIK
jgi:thioredoxin 1